MDPQSPAALTFILRLWLEKDDAGHAPGEWRGELKHVPSGRSAYFRTFDGIAGALHRLLHEVEQESAQGAPHASGG